MHADFGVTFLDTMAAWHRYCCCGVVADGSCNLLENGAEVRIMSYHTPEINTSITAWKALFFKDRLQQVSPVHWDIDLTLICDHRCPGCFYIGLPEDGFDSGQGVYRDTTPRMLQSGLVLDAISTIAKTGGKAITIVGGGEPTLHRNIVEILLAIKEAGLKFGLVSHFGLPYKEEFFVALLGATWIRVSVNAGTAGIYAKMQGVRADKFGLVLRNVRHYSGLGGKVGVSFLIHPDNIHEIMLAAEVFSNAGAAYIQYKPYITDQKDSLYTGFGDAISSQLEQAKQFSSARFQVLDQFQPRISQLQRYWRHESCGRCWVPRFNPKIAANGKVYMCCELAYSTRGILGDLNVSNLEDIITSDAWLRAEAAVDTGQCPPCWERDLNKVINDGSFQQMEPPQWTPDADFI